MGYEFKKVYGNPKEQIVGINIEFNNNNQHKTVSQRKVMIAQGRKLDLVVNMLQGPILSPLLCTVRDPKFL